MDEPALDAAGVHLGFRLMLRRPPENARVVAHYLGLNLTLPAFLTILLESEEFQERQSRLVSRGDLRLDTLTHLPSTADKRVILFGAFGNGNVGDAAQVDAVAAMLKKMAPSGCQLGFAATSWERTASYATHETEVLRPDALLRPEHVRQRVGRGDGGGADLIVIGGGGLLGAPHFPLHEPRWAEWFVGRGVPFVLLGVGGGAEALSTSGWSEAYNLLFRHAAFVGLRDEETLAAARLVRPEAVWFPDPVLANTLSSRAAAPKRRRDIAAVLIPRSPNSAADQAALTQLLALARTARAAGQNVVVAALEPDTDRAVLQGETVEFVVTWDDLLALCERAEAVVSARLHGVVAGLASGCAVHGLAQPKTGDLMRRLGIEDWFHASGWPATPVELSPIAARRFGRALAPGLVTFRRDMDAAITQASACLTPLLARGPDHSGKAPKSSPPA